MKKYISSIDYYKFICAIMVVFLHTVNITELYGTCNNIKTFLYHFTWSINPVEFFFCVSVYFLFKNDINDEKLRKYIKRLIKLYVIWSIIYLPSTLIECFANSSFVYGFLKLVRRIFILGTSGHLWYVIALIYGLIIMYPIIRANKIRIAWGISIISYTIVVIGEAYHNVANNYPQFYVLKIPALLQIILGSLYLFRAPLFIMIGYSLAQINDFPQITKLKYLEIWGIAALLCNLELNIISKYRLGGQCNNNKTICSYNFFCYGVQQHTDRFTYK